MPGRILAEAADRHTGDRVAALVHLTPATVNSEKRWLLAEQLAERDPLDDVTG